MENNCSICQKVFSVISGKGRNKKYCSKECSNKANNISKAAWKKRNIIRNVVLKKECMQCTKPFETIFSFQNHCSTKCYRKSYIKPEKTKLREKKNYILNKAAQIKRSKSRYASKREEILKRQKLYLENLSDEQRILKREKLRNWYKSPRGRAYTREIHQKKRRLVRIQTPKWNNKAKTQEIFRITAKIEGILNKSLVRNKMPKVKLNVDHIIPLQGKTFEEGAPISGLNVWYNLMPILETDNKQKQSLCPPSKKIESIEIEHLSLDKLPLPKDYMNYVRLIYVNALKAEKNSDHLIKLKKIQNLELNPRKLKN